jgi:hypothetical protein
MSSQSGSGESMLPTDSSFHWFDCKKAGKTGKMKSIPELMSSSFREPECSVSLPFTQPKAKQDDILDEPSPNSITACFEDSPSMLDTVDASMPTVAAYDNITSLESFRFEERKCLVEEVELEKGSGKLIDEGADLLKDPTSEMSRFSVFPSTLSFDSLSTEDDIEMHSSYGSFENVTHNSYPSEPIFRKHVFFPLVDKCFKGELVHCTVRSFYLFLVVCEYFICCYCRHLLPIRKRAMCC